jgi:hypothetical protein
MAKKISKGIKAVTSKTEVETTEVRSNGKKNSDVRPVQETLGFLSHEQLALVNDDELWRYSRRLNEARDVAVRTRASTSQVEIELCYVQREIELRQKRNDLHDVYVQGLEQQIAGSGRGAWWEEDDYLPGAEIDNIDFVRLCELRDEYAKRGSRRIRA